MTSEALPPLGRDWTERSRLSKACFGSLKQIGVLAAIIALLFAGTATAHAKPKDHDEAGSIGTGGAPAAPNSGGVMVPGDRYGLGGFTNDWGNREPVGPRDYSPSGTGWDDDRLNRAPEDKGSGGGLPPGGV